MAGSGLDPNARCYVPVELGERRCYGLVDSGAGVTICDASLLPDNVELDTRNNVTVQGVTGSKLNILGKFTTDISIGNFQLRTTLLVTDNMSTNLFIIGRDILQEFEGTIDFKRLVLILGGASIPMMKPYTSPRTNSNRCGSLQLRCTKTVVVEPSESAIIPAHIQTSGRKSKCHKVYFTSTGLLEPSFATQHSLIAPAGVANSTKGKCAFAVRNTGNEPVVLYRGARVGTFETMRDSDIWSMNVGAGSARAHMADVGAVTADIEGADTTSHTRWSTNLTDLFRILKLDDLGHLGIKQLDQVKGLIGDFRDIFSTSEEDVGCTDMAEQTITLDTQLPIRDRYYNIPLALRHHAEEEIQRLLDLNIIQPSTSSYHSPSFLMKKPNGSYRLLTDFRRLNKHTIRSWQPLPGLEEMVVLWNGCKFFSKVDFIRGFYQTKLTPESRHMTATSIPGVGFFEYVRSPLGLSGSPCFFQSLVEKIFMGLKNKQCVCYLDDILSGAQTFEAMIENLRAIFGRIRMSKMLLKPSKCEFFKTSIKFLGVILSDKGIGVCPEKVESVVNMAPPKNVKGVRSFLGLSGFYRRFIPQYSKIAEPLTRLTKKDSRFEWSDKANEAWLTIKQKLVDSPILAHPDLGKRFTLITDASAYCIGGILAQEGEDGKLRSVSYGSSILNDTQRRWSTIERELWALVYFCKKFKTFLLGTDFSVITDNKGLLKLENYRDIKSDRLWRWFETLADFKFTTEYAPSKQNPSDCLSRLPSVNDPLLETLPANSEAVGGARVMAGTIVQQPEVTSPVVPESPLVTFTDSTLREAQARDRVLNIVRTWVIEGKRPGSSNNLSNELYTYYNSFDRLKLRDGVLVRSWERVDGEAPVDLACVPESLQNTVIVAAHNLLSSGHLAARKTLSRIRSRFYFPKMDMKTKLHVASCHVCLKKRCNVPKLKAPLTPYSGKSPGHIIQMDLMENLPVARGYHAILVIVDTFSKMAEAIKLRSTTVEVVAKAFVDTWVCRHGVPIQVHTDRGGNLETADLIKAVYKHLGIVKTANQSYRPQTDGCVERMNKTIKTMLWKYCQNNPKAWVDSLDQVMFAYRTSVHSSTGFSPFFLERGRLPRLPMDILMGTAAESTATKRGEEWALELYNKMNQIYGFVQDHLGGRQISSKRRYDRSTHVKVFPVGSWVYVWKPTPQGCTYKKFYDNFRGPFRVVARVTSHTYKIALDEHANRYDVVHMEHLKDAQIPEGEEPTIAVKHYRDDLQSVLEQPLELQVEGSEEEDEPFDPGSSAGVDSGGEGILRDRERLRPRRSSPLIRIPRSEPGSAVGSGPRRSTRNRTQTVPFQHPHCR